MDSFSSVETISKGVKAFAFSRKFLRSAAVVMLVGRGSIQDPLEGCACLTNRMHLRLTSRLSPLKLQVTIDRLGASVDATTDRDLMMLRAQVPSKQVKDCVKFLAELYSNPYFNDSEVEKEKSSQKLEYERVRQDPTSAAIEDAWEATFPKNPLGHPITGYPQSIEKLTPGILEEFDAVARQTAPLIVGIVGPQKANMLLDYLRSSFENFHNRHEISKVKLGSRRDFNVLRRVLEVEQTTLALGMVTSGVSSSDYPALLLIEDYLGSHRHYLGVLMKELREKRGLTYFAYSMLSAFRDCGLLTAYAGVRHEKITEALKLILKAIDDLRKRTITEEELEKLKSFHKGIIGTRLDVPFEAAMWLALNLFRGGRVDFESYISDINAVSSEMIMKTARDFLTPSRMALSISGRPPEESDLVNILKEELS